MLAITCRGKYKLEPGFKLRIFPSSKLLVLPSLKSKAFLPHTLQNLAFSTKQGEVE